MDHWDDETDDKAEELRDFAFGGKDALIFLLDASPPMHRPIAGHPDGHTPFQVSLQCARDTLKEKVFRSPNDLCGVLLFGTDKKVDVRDFDHLSLVLPLHTPEADAILKLETLLEDEDDHFDRTYGQSSDFSLHEALWQCQSLFAGVEVKLALKKIVLLTCTDDPHAAEARKQRQALQKAKDLRDSGVYLDVLPLRSQGDGDFSLKRFYQDVVHVDDEDNEAVPQPAANLDDLAGMVRKRDHKKRSVGKLHFDLGRGVKISVATYNLVQKATKPSKVKLARDTNEEVKSQRTFVHPHTAAPLLPSEINKYQEYGGRKIEFTQDETKSLVMMEGDLGLKLCGFKPLTSLRWGHFVRSAYFIYPDDKLIQGSRQLFAALLIKCLERQVVAVCSFKARDTSGPSFVALVPQAEEAKDESKGKKSSPPGFHLVFLPFADDLRTVPNVKLVEPHPEQLDAATRVIKKLKMRSYAPEAFRNPDLQAHQALIESLALHKDDVEMGEDQTMPPVERMSKKLDGIGQEFLDAVYPDNYNPDAALTKRKAPAATSKAQPAKKAKASDDGNIDIGQYVKSKTVQKLTVNELKKFLQSEGVSVSGLKKAQLVEEVYSHYEKK